MNRCILGFYQANSSSSAETIERDTRIRWPAHTWNTWIYLILILIYQNIHELRIGHVRKRFVWIYFLQLCMVSFLGSFFFPSKSCMHRCVVQSPRNCFLIFIEAAVRRCSVKKMFLEILRNSQEITCARYFFNKKSATFLKKSL